MEEKINFKNMKVSNKLKLMYKKNNLEDKTRKVNKI